MPNNSSVLDWLQQGDPSIRWQVMRDLMHCSEQKVQVTRQQISQEGWGARLLAEQDDDGRWGAGWYSPKWISTTYSLLLLKRLGLEPKHPQALLGCQRLLDHCFYRDGGINIHVSYDYSETCVTGMVLSLLAYFQLEDTRIESLVDHLLRQRMPDGAWNCESYRGARHSSLHTTICVLEGLQDFGLCSAYRQVDIQQAQADAHEFLLQHKLFRSDHTGQVIDVRMTRFSFPPRWRYDLLRALDYLQAQGLTYDERLSEAIDMVKNKQRQDGTWLLQNRHPGKTFFELEQVAMPSRWNTLRALRVLRFYDSSS